MVIDSEFDSPWVTHMVIDRIGEMRNLMKFRIATKIILCGWIMIDWLILTTC